MTDLDTAILEGLQLLLTLRLSGAPAEDTIDAVADVWLLTFKRGRAIDWQEGDGERVRAAFVAVAAHAERWPTPSQVLDRLPPRPERPRLPRPTRPMPSEVRAQLDALMGRLLVSDRPRAAGFDETTWPAVAERLEAVNEKRGAGSEKREENTHRSSRPAPRPPIPQPGDDHA